MTNNILTRIGHSSRWGCPRIGLLRGRICAWMAMNERKIKKALIIVPTISLCIQMKKDFEDYGWDIPIDVKFNKSKFYKKIKITLKNGTVILKNFEDIIETKRGKIMAKDILETDDIL